MMESATHSGNPRDGSASVDDPTTRLLSKERAQYIHKLCKTNSVGGGFMLVQVGSIWQQTIRWARNRVVMASDRDKQLVLIQRQPLGFHYGTASSNQFDDTTILDILRTAELRGTIKSLNNGSGRMPGFTVDVPSLGTGKAQLWSDDSARATAEERAKLATMIAEQAESRELLSAGSVEIRMCAFAQHDDIYGFQYTRYTQAYSSVTVRHPKGTGSGWAGESGFDWKLIDPSTIAERALTKCIKSIDPVRIEPGRYTVILEPQAVASLIWALLSAFDRNTAEQGLGPFVSHKDRESGLQITKLGSSIMDERVTIYHDPDETGTGVLPVAGMQTIKWIERGVLTTLEDGSVAGSRGGTSLPKRNENVANLQRRAFRMEGGDTSVDEMIRTTKRGLLVTRFWGLQLIDQWSLLTSGVTRDGMWLIENGVVTKPVLNMRFVESPLFVLNQLDQIGESVPVFFPPISGGGNLLGLLEFLIGPISGVAPTIKAHDFNFLALVDAV